MRTKTCPLFRTGKMLTAVGTSAAVGFYAFGRRIMDGRFRSQPRQKVRTKTCPLFRTGRVLSAVGTLAAVGFYAFGRGIKNRRFRSQPGHKVRTKTCPLFRTEENADCGRNLCWRWLLRIRPRNQGQKIPIPARTEGADLILSASRWEPGLA